MEDTSEDNCGNNHTGITSGPTSFYFVLGFSLSSFSNAFPDEKFSYLLNALENKMKYSEEKADVSYALATLLSNLTFLLIKPTLICLNRPFRN